MKRKAFLSALFTLPFAGKLKAAPKVGGPQMIIMIPGDFRIKGSDLVRALDRKKPRK